MTPQRRAKEKSWITEPPKIKREKRTYSKDQILDSISSEGKLDENTEKLLIDLIKELKSSLK